MKDPIKIIHKYKNINRRVQYQVYIFLGSLVPDNIIKVLNKIKEKAFYDMLNSISSERLHLVNSSLFPSHISFNTSLLK